MLGPKETTIMLDDSAVLQMLGGGAGMQHRKGLHGVLVASPDPTKHVRVGGAGDMGFMVPMADPMTQMQPGFDQSKAGMVMIDPDESGNGTLVDFSKITPDDVNRAMRMGGDPSDAMKKLAVIKPIRPASAPKVAGVHERQSITPRVVLPELPAIAAIPQHPTPMLPPLVQQPVIPPRIILPNFGNDQPQMPQQGTAMPPMIQPQQFTQPTHLPVTSGYVAPAAPQQAPQPDPMAMMMGMFQGLQMQIDALSRQQPQQQVPAPQPELDPALFVKQAVPEVDISSLGIPWLGLDVVAPTIDVMFNMGASGGVRTRYHHVEITDTTIMLIFDSRCEYATEFTPPFLQDRNAPPLILQIGKSKTPFEANHLPGLDFALGVFHVTLLLRVIHEPEQEIKDPAGIL